MAAWPAASPNRTLAGKTRRVYDRVAAVYPVSTMLFHSRAHRAALAASGISDGMNVLEVATGSGEMFRKLVRVNRNGRTVGVDLSPNMASRTQRHAQRKYPSASAHCQAVDASRMPFKDAAFDAVVCCYLLELLSPEDMVSTVHEFRRVLRKHGKLTLVLIGQQIPLFNACYRIAGKIAPAFWGRQVARNAPEVVESAPFEIIHDMQLRQGYYPSRVLVARK
jgi:ubiquinone/menaquinone biosynthesis C-methylase UbiE